MKALFASKAFIAAVIIGLGIGAVAMITSWTVDLSSRDAYNAPSVRL